MADWARHGYPVERGVSRARDVLTGIAAGLIAQLAVSQVDRVLRGRISSQQKLREKLVREGSPHEVASERFGLAFTLGYGLLWGAIYALARVVITPRMHGIHHSIVERETDSNWGTILSLPDYLHGTIRLNVPQQAIDIGIPAFRRGEEVRLGRLMRMPFGVQRPSWRLEGFGPKPERQESLPSERAARAAASAP
jgi:hypothetical protein